MRNNKRRAMLLAFVVAASALAGGCGSQAQLADDSLISVEDTEFRTATASIGDLSEQIKMDAELYSAASQSICSKYEGVIFQEYAVKAKDVVKKGDLIARVTKPDTDTKAQKQSNLEAKQKELETMTAYYETNVASLQSQVGSSSGHERNIASYKLERMQMERDYILQNCRDQIEQIQKEMDQAQELPEDVNIYAEFDGQIDGITSIKAGTVLSPDRPIGTMHDNSTVLVKTKYRNTLTYGEKVTVYSGSGEGRQEIQGTVVGADNILPEMQATGATFIKLEGDYNKNALTSLQVEATGYEIKQVLTIPEYAVTESKGQYYVYVQDGDQLKRRHIAVGGSDGTNVWVLQGLEEGEVVSVQ